MSFSIKDLDPPLLYTILHPLNPTSVHSRPIPSSGTVCRGSQVRQCQMDHHLLSLLACGVPLLLPWSDHSPYNARIADPWLALLFGPSSRLGCGIAGEKNHLSFHDHIPAVPASCASHSDDALDPQALHTQEIPKDAPARKDSRCFPFRSA